MDTEPEIDIKELRYLQETEKDAYLQVRINKQVKKALEENLGPDHDNLSDFILKKIFAHFTQMNLNREVSADEPIPGYDPGKKEDLNFDFFEVEKFNEEGERIGE